MWKNLAVAVLPALIAVGTIGCQGPAQTGPADRVDLASVEPVQIHQQVHGESQALDQTAIEVISSQAALDDLGVDELDQLNVNFNEEEVVIVALGQQSTGGYWTDIIGAQFDSQDLWVQFVVNRPGDHEAATQAQTYPFAAAVIDRVPWTQVHGDPENLVGEQRPQDGNYDDLLWSDGQTWDDADFDEPAAY